MAFLKPCFRLLMFAAAIAGEATIADESGFEETADLSATSILPPELLRGKHYVVDDRVRNDGYLNYYTIRSDFGEFEAVGTAMLRTRIGEINALAELDELSKTEVFAKAAADAGMRQVRTLKAFAEKPVETVKGIPAGIGRMFYRFKRQAGDAYDATKEYVASDDEEAGSDEDKTDDDSNKAVELTESYLGVDKAHRAWSRKLGYRSVFEQQGIARRDKRSRVGRAPGPHRHGLRRCAEDSRCQGHQGRQRGRME